VPNPASEPSVNVRLTQRDTIYIAGVLEIAEGVTRIKLEDGAIPENLTEATMQFIDWMSEFADRLVDLIKELKSQDVVVETEGDHNAETPA